MVGVVQKHTYLLSDMCVFVKNDGTGRVRFTDRRGWTLPKAENAMTAASGGQAEIGLQGDGNRRVIFPATRERDRTTPGVAVRTPKESVMLGRLLEGVARRRRPQE